MIAKLRCLSPLGELTVAADETAILALTFSGQKYETEHIPDSAVERETPLLLAACRWLDAYFAGEKPESGLLPLNPQGSVFRRLVWRELLLIPYGQTVAYGEIAHKLGASARAVGGAVGHNPISILIPCHRVVGADGGLTGYAGGLERKKQLLALEGAV